jgi:hypothetical protein
MKAKAKINAKIVMAIGAIVKMALIGDGFSST